MTAGDRAAAAARCVIAALVAAALVTNLVLALQAGLPAQNLSYFTNQSNLLFVVVVGIGIGLGVRRPPWFDDLRGAAAFYLLMTGLVYAVVVAPVSELLRWDIGWQGIVLHRLTPVAALADWLLTPRRHVPRARRIGLWLLYPVAFVLLTWIRGGITGWYPYAFLDPTASSWAQVLVTTGVVVLAFLVSALAVHLLEGRLRTPQPARLDAPQPADPVTA